MLFKLSGTEFSLCTYRIDAGNGTGSVAKGNTDSESLPGFHGDSVRAVAHFGKRCRERKVYASRIRGKSRADGWLRPRKKKIFLDCLIRLWLVLIDSGGGAFGKDLLRIIGRCT